MLSKSRWIERGALSKQLAGLLLSQVCGHDEELSIQSGFPHLPDCHKTQPTIRHINKSYCMMITPVEYTDANDTEFHNTEGKYLNEKTTIICCVVQHTCSKMNKGSCRLSMPVHMHGHWTETQIKHLQYILIKNNSSGLKLKLQQLTVTSSSGHVNTLQPSQNQISIKK